VLIKSKAHQQIVKTSVDHGDSSRDETAGVGSCGNIYEQFAKLALGCELTDLRTDQLDGIRGLPPDAEQRGEDGEAFLQGRYGPARPCLSPDGSAGGAG
jgi:hypothetical protein